MRINWIKPGIDIAPGLEEGQLEIEWLPGIPMDVLFQNPAPSATDLEERHYLVTKAEEVANSIIQDPLTRRAVFYNLHHSELPINCMNLFHFMYRDEKLEAYVYARSINLKNLGYDLCTIDMVYRSVFERIKEVLKEVRIGKVLFHIASLHYYKNEK